MLGKEGFEQTKQSKAAKAVNAAGAGASPSSSPSSNTSSTTTTTTTEVAEKQNFKQQPSPNFTSTLPANFDDTEYTISSLTISRELGFIIGIAIPETDKGSSTKGGKLKRSSSSASSNSSSGNGNNGGCYLFTYNLKGNLIKCVEIAGGAGGGGKDHHGGVILQTSRDGEYILLTEGGTTIKILRAFDLTPLYSFNTADAPSGGGGSSTSASAAAQSLQPVDRIRSLQLVDLKYLLVGLENGRFLVYNIDFNRWNHEYSNRY